MSSDVRDSAVERALAILEQLCASESSVTLSDLGERLGLPLATIHRLTQQLERAGAVIREPPGKRISPGPRLRRMCVDALLHSARRGVRQQIMRRLVDKIHETCNFTMFDGDAVVYVDRVESSWPLRAHLQPGSRVPLHCSASGKLFLSMLAARTRRRILETLDLAPQGPNAITNVADLEASLKSIRRQRIGEDDEELFAGLVGLTVPVEDEAGRVVAALGIHAPKARMTIEQAKQWVPEMRATAIELARTLGDAWDADPDSTSRAPAPGRT